MHEFLATPYGFAVFLAVDVVALLIIFTLGYRWLFKRFFDLFFSGLALILLSPIFLYVCLSGRKARECEEGRLSLLQRDIVLGKKRKRVFRTVFRFTGDDGEVLGEYGKKMQTSKLRKLPYLIDVFLGRTSFIGILPLTAMDGEFLEEKYEDRFSVRTGLIHPTVLNTDECSSYEEVFDLECAYTEKMGFWHDLHVLIVWILQSVRGERKTGVKSLTACSYADTLLANGEISNEDYQTVKAFINE